MFKILKKVMMAYLLRVVAEDVIDSYRLKFPTAHWSVWLDRAEDIVWNKTGADRGTCGRAVRAAIKRREKIKADE